MSAAPAAAAAPTPAEVLKYDKPTGGFLCPITANTFGIDFLAFKIRDIDSGKVIFEVAKDPNAPPTEFPPGFDFDQLRHISYKFPADFLRCKTVGTTLTFKVGAKPVRNFRMIERHYFKDKLMQSYDFNFKFCIPESTNEWESIYHLPVLSEKEVAEIVANPEMSKSDSFYFVEGALIMHNKATYTYIEEKAAAAAPPAGAAAAADPKAAPKGGAAGGAGGGAAAGGGSGKPAAGGAAGKPAGK